MPKPTATERLNPPRIQTLDTVAQQRHTPSPEALAYAVALRVL
ncbi:MAG: hypothetical protein ACXWD8_04480 [Mycobacterium sp.]